MLALLIDELHSQGVFQERTGRFAGPAVLLSAQPGKAHRGRTMPETRPRLSGWSGRVVEAGAADEFDELIAPQLRGSRGWAATRAQKSCSLSARANDSMTFGPPSLAAVRIAKDRRLVVITIPYRPR